MNGFSAPEFNMLHGDLTDKISGKYDVVTANIVADAIIKLTPAIKAFLKEGAVYIVSGIIDTRENDVLPVLEENGFTVTERRTEAGWVCLTCNMSTLKIFGCENRGFIRPTGRIYFFRCLTSTYFTLTRKYNINVHFWRRDNETDNLCRCSCCA